MRSVFVAVEVDDDRAEERESGLESVGVGGMQLAEKVDCVESAGTAEPNVSCCVCDAGVGW